jgi:hypothetical protein
MNYLAIGVAAVVAFVASAIWYIAFADAMTRLRPASAGASSMSPALALAEIVRALVVALVVAEIAVLAGVADWTAAVMLGALLWIGFPLILLTGSVIHERVPWRLAAIHAGDWMVKLVLISVIVGVWR